MDPKDIPATNRGGSRSRLPDAEQDMLRTAAKTGQAVTDSKLHASPRAARTAAGAYRRFLRNLIKNGDATGRVSSHTWHDDSDKKAGYRWAVSVVTD